MSDLKKIKDEFLSKLSGKLDISEINQIKSVIESYPSTQVSDVKIEEIEDTIKLTLRTESLKSSIVLSDDLSMKVNKALTNVTYSNIDNQQVTTLLFK